MNKFIIILGLVSMAVFVVAVRGDISEPYVFWGKCFIPLLAVPAIVVGWQLYKRHFKNLNPFTNVGCNSLLLSALIMVVYGLSLLLGHEWTMLIIIFAAGGSVTLTFLTLAFIWYFFDKLSEKIFSR